MTARSNDGSADLSQLRKGVLELAVLALLRRRPHYGGELAEALADSEGLAASAGTLYPLLTRLRTAGWVDTSWQESPSGPPRKYYTLTRAGRQQLARLERSWATLVRSVDELLEER
ncbi:PadR family transcriptional regulator [Enemella evansiae]|uniref:PadR family transcriptional regulator n=1 Tax=Enemella evansiae TaxID=2016499 RepID=A0A255G7T4_9ACTN|nr:PadR family transcriptional regulator [Enemella evansiae]OYO04784.1 PadR family transcriptional regulator [Enemella evansiae]OYO06425.1 PadR family transcriptional regulator [Enemella evansiae]OYO07807.1 PadR family transcriptional regulator [Enemella evansiae]OYO08934.1 PadR family transcriptional regulator [Enemella evansiae]OYO11601.1 PadR family transcriptional regulator [Enemella evansiae]